MLFVSCQSLGRAFARRPLISAPGGADPRPVARLATGNIVGSTLHVSAAYVIAALALMAMLRGPLLAQESSADRPVQPPQPPPQLQPSRPLDSANPRFAFHPIEGGFVRLDLVTGAVASCRQAAADWSCVPAREERAALDREIAQLQRDNASLKNALLEHGVPLPPTLRSPTEAVPRTPQLVPPAPPPPPPSAKSSPDDAEIERAMIVMERVWRRLFEIIKDIQRDLEKKG